jgi:hypothetical protein
MRDNMKRWTRRTGWLALAAAMISAVVGSVDTVGAGPSESRDQALAAGAACSRGPDGEPSTNDQGYWLLAGVSGLSL